MAFEVAAPNVYLGKYVFLADLSRLFPIRYFTLYTDTYMGCISYIRYNPVRGNTTHVCVSINEMLYLLNEDRRSDSECK